MPRQAGGRTGQRTQNGKDFTVGLAFVIHVSRSRFHRSKYHPRLRGLRRGAYCPGTAVWRFTPGFDLEVEPEAIDARLNNYVLCCDEARFLNHASEPNLVQDLTEGGHGVDRAARDIAVGEELTVDDGTFETTWSRNP
ncbi:MAG: SET domain-containing protein [Rhodothermales bacterium]